MKARKARDNAEPTIKMKSSSPLKSDTPAMQRINERINTINVSFSSNAVFSKLPPD